MGEEYQENSFIKEKIKNKPINKKRLLYQMGWIAFAGVVFGVAASVTFVTVKPKLEKFTGDEKETMVTIPRDEEQTGMEASQESQTGEQSEVENAKDGQTKNQSGAEGSIQEGQTGSQLGSEDSQKDASETEDIQEGQTGSQLGPEGSKDGQTENQSGTGESTQEQQQSHDAQGLKEEIEAFQKLQNQLFLIGKKANRSVVTVTGVKNNIDWFESSYESETQASGIIIANNGQELLILTEKKIIDQAEEIYITFINNVLVSANVKKYDANTGIAIISVPLEEVAKETIAEIDVAVLGNSFLVNQGTMVLAIGSPLGANYSISIGNITSTNNIISMWDRIYTVFTTDIMGSTSGSGVLINLKGEVVGLVMQEYSSEGDRNTITALSISQLKGIIEDLSNGKAIPYLGLKVSTVTEEIAKEYYLPKGVYIKNVETDVASPAMNAGMQAGDVLVEFNGEEVLTVEQYTTKLMALSPEQSVKLKVLRQSGEEYVELVCDAVVGVRQ